MTSEPESQEQTVAEAVKEVVQDAAAGAAAPVRWKWRSWSNEHLVPQWRKFHKFLSVRSLALQTAILVAWSQVPDDLKNSLPGWLLPAIAIFILGVGTIGAMMNQKGLNHD